MKKNLLLLSFSIFFTLVAMEFLLRLIPLDQPKSILPPKTDWALVPERIWTEHHPILGWYHQTNKTALLKLSDREVSVHTNSIGFRGSREYDPQKAEGIQRIMVIGDSFPFGFGVEDQETFSAQLESLNKKREVLNLGVPGFGMDQILLSYRELGKSFKPDIVLVCIFPEDFWRATRAFADSGHAKPYFTLNGENQLVLHNVPVPEKYSLNTNQFPDLVEFDATKKLLMKSRVYRMGRKAFMRLAKNLRWIDPDMTDEWVLGRALLKEINHEIIHSGAKPIYVIIPPKNWVESERRPSLHKSMIRFMARENLDLLDLTPVFQSEIKSRPITDFYIEGDWHWTAEGHTVVARTLEDYLKNYTQEGM